MSSLRGFTLLLSVNDYIYHIDGYHKKYYKYAQNPNQIIINSNDNDDNNNNNPIDPNINFLEEYFLNPIKTLFNYIASKSVLFYKSSSFSKILVHEGNFQDITRTTDHVENNNCDNVSNDLTIYRKIINKLNTIISTTKKIDNDHEKFCECLKDVLLVLQMLCDTDSLSASLFKWKLIINSSKVIDDCDGSFVLESDSNSVSVTSIKYEVVSAYSVYSLSSSTKHFMVNINLPFTKNDKQISEYSNKIDLVTKFKSLLIKVIVMLNQ
mgnify:CR=1 FL=1